MPPNNIKAPFVLGSVQIQIEKTLNLNGQERQTEIEINDDWDHEKEDQLVCLQDIQLLGVA